MEKSQLMCVITLAVYILAAVFFLAGIGGPNWVESENTNLGLWKLCVTIKNGDSKCTNIEMTDDNLPGTSDYVSLR